MRHLGDIVRLNAIRFGNKKAVIFENSALTFAELDASANAVGCRLQNMGISPGDRVAILAENCLGYLPTNFGIMKSGAICVPLNFHCTLYELEHMVRDSGVRLIFFTSAYYDQARTLAARVGGIEFVEINATLLNPHSRPLDPLPARFGEDEPAAIMYTSGTTGTPKGAILPHRALLASAAGIALATRIRHGDRAVVTVPLFHGSGMYVVGCSHLYVGASLVVTRKFVADQVLSLIEQHDVTTFFGVAAQYSMLLDAKGSSAGAPGRLQNGWYGGAPMPVELVKRSQQLWPEVRFQQLYGQTETTITTVLDADDHDRKIGSAGRELSYVEMRVVDGQGQDCPAGIIGEVIVRREAGMSGYFNNPEQTASTIRDGWIYTGDLGFLDDEHFLTLSDRKRDVIISGGENIYPKEIEEVLYAHEAVAEAAVIGIADPKWGEVPMAAVVLRADSDVSTLDLQAWCEERLARYKIPRRWHLTDVLPKTANGKIRKQSLRDMVDALKK